MTTEKLLDKLTGLLDAGRRKQESKHESLKKLLGKLKKRQEKYKQKLEVETDEAKRKQIERTLKVIYTQRKKGVALYKEITKGLNDDPRI